MKDSRWDRTEHYCNEVGGLNNCFIQGKLKEHVLTTFTKRACIRGLYTWDLLNARVARTSLHGLNTTTGFGAWIRSTGVVHVLYTHLSLLVLTCGVQKFKSLYRRAQPLNSDQVEFMGLVASITTVH